jgi:hypothetical protein
MAKLTVINTNVSDARLAERLVISWTADQNVPADSAASLPSAIAEIEALTTPIDGKALAVLLMQTLKIWTPPDDFDDTAQFYREALEDVPADLVQAALKHLRQTLKWFPKPCELRAPIEDELRRRRDILRRLKLMEQRVRLGDVAKPALRAVRTDAEKAEAEAIAAKTRAVLDSVELKRVPARVDDARDPASVADSYAATRDALAARAAMKAAAQETASASAGNTMSCDGGGA